MNRITPSHTATFCSTCGEPAAGGPFCSRCGARVDTKSAEDLAAAATGEMPAAGAELRVEDLRGTPTAPAQPVVRRPAPPPPAYVPPVEPSVGGRPRRSWLPWVVAAVVLALVGAGVAVFLLTRTGSDDGVAYRHRVASIFGPVLGSNRAVSHALNQLHGKSPAARQTVHQAQSSVSSAQGALSALAVPTSEERLASQARQALAREASYYSAVASILADPANSTPGEAQTLAGSASSALAAGGPTLAGTSPTISGADKLTAWARRTARSHHSASGGSSSGSASSTASSSPPPAASNPYANGRDCGSGVFAGPNTSCEFAFNVRDAYENAPGAAASVTVYSPVTGQTYTMDCSPAGSGITCSGGNDASVTF